MNERIKELRMYLNLTQAEFAEKVNLSRNFVTLIETQGRTISDRTIADICRVFHVRQEWLISGEGDMFQQSAREDEISQFFGKVLADKSNSFRFLFVSALSRLSEDDWQNLADMMHRMAQDNEKKAGE